MGKYEPLGQFLRKQKRSRIPMTFREIERLIGAPLPASKKNRAFWSNNPDNNVMTREWVAAGFKTGEIDIQSEKLVFERSPAGQSDMTNWQRAYGCMKGKIWLDPDWDTSQPAIPESDWSTDLTWLNRLKP